MSLSLGAAGAELPVDGAGDAELFGAVVGAFSSLVLLVLHAVNAPMPTMSAALVAAASLLLTFLGCIVLPVSTVEGRLDVRSAWQAREMNAIPKSGRIRVFVSPALARLLAPSIVRAAMGLAD